MNIVYRETDGVYISKHFLWFKWKAWTIERSLGVFDLNVGKPQLFKITLTVTSAVESQLDYFRGYESFLCL